jgi:hypothetical protein
LKQGGHQFRFVIARKCRAFDAHSSVEISRPSFDDVHHGRGRFEDQPLS